MEKIRRHIIFYGYVQGVGFRYRASYIANRFGVTGWVKNCIDGSVEMEAEGFTKDIDTMIKCLEDDDYISIERIQSNNIPVEGGYLFEII